MSDLRAAQDNATPEQREIRHLKHEVEMLTSAGVIECMVRNKAVSEYIGNLEAERDALKADAGRLDFLQANHTWSTRWQKRPKREEQWAMRDDGEPWGNWHSTIREAIDAAINEQQ